MKKSIYAISILLLLLTVISCSNSASGEEEEHHPEGFRLNMNGQTVVEQLPEQDILSGELVLVAGESTDLITILFLDHDGHAFQPEDDGYSLGYSFTKEDNAELVQHAEDGKWSFHLHAESEGETGLLLKLLHGSHADFTSLEIPINVEAAE